MNFHRDVSFESCTSQMKNLEQINIAKLNAINCLYADMYDLHCCSPARLTDALINPCSSLYRVRN